MDDNFPTLEGHDYPVPWITESTMNMNILNYLVVEGYKNAALKFAKEANLEATIDDLID